MRVYRITFNTNSSTALMCIIKLRPQTSCRDYSGKLGILIAPSLYFLERYQHILRQTIFKIIIELTHITHYFKNLLKTTQTTLFAQNMPDERDLINYQRYLSLLQNGTGIQLNPHDLHYVSVLLRNKF